MSELSARDGMINGTRSGQLMFAIAMIARF
jgi:hypothetical protein